MNLRVAKIMSFTNVNYEVVQNSCTQNLKTIG